MYLKKLEPVKYDSRDFLVGFLNTAYLTHKKNKALVKKDACVLWVDSCEGLADNFLGKFAISTEKFSRLILYCLFIKENIWLKETIVNIE